MKSLDDELQDSPRLRELKKMDDGLRLPDHYFEQLEQEIFKKLDADGSRKPPVPQPAVIKPLFNWWKGGRWQPRVAVAAAAVLLVGMVAWWLLWRSTANTPVLVELTEEEVELFLMSHPHELVVEALPTELVEASLPFDQPFFELQTDFLKTEDLENLLHSMPNEDDF